MTHLSATLAKRYGGPESAAPAATLKNAAVSLVLRSPGTNPDTPLITHELLFIRRARSKRDPWSGQMALPGGRMEASDPSLLAAAIRETREETGINLRPRSTIVGRLAPAQPATEKLPSLKVWPFVFRAPAGALARVNSAEVAAVHWFPLAELQNQANRGVWWHESEGARAPFPCIRLKSETIWGLTYRIVDSFLALTGPRG